MREVQDHYFRQAKAEGFLSRAAYKLIEIDDRKKILRSGDFVLDCGCAPGSWLQVASRRVGPRGHVVGIDLQPLRHTFEPNVRTIVGDFTATPVAQLLGSADSPRLFDVVLSDMAPSTTGDPAGDHHRSVRLCETLLDHAPQLLRSGGHLVMKVFEGATYPDLLRRTHGQFESVKGFKPKASRSESSEMYIVATGYRGDHRSDESTSASAVARKRVSTGWNTRSAAGDGAQE